MKKREELAEYKKKTQEDELIKQPFGANGIDTGWWGINDDSPF
jgi:hypothetical protein